MRAQQDRIHPGLIPVEPLGLPGALTRTSSFAIEFRHIEVPIAQIADEQEY